MFKIILNNCCGLDVHKTRIYACIGITDAHSRTEYYEANFSSFPKDLRKLAEWLYKYNCVDVCMESSGKYWIPAFNVLEETCKVTLAHPGEKFDVAPFVDKRCKPPLDVIQDAVDGAVSPEQAVKLRECLDHIDELVAHRKRIEKQILSIADSFSPQLALIRFVPALNSDPMTAIVILSEIDSDMSVFPSAKHLVSWAGCCPRNDRSAKHIKSTRISQAGSCLKPLLVQVANALINSKDHPDFFERYRRIKSHRGHKKAIIAICKMLLTAFWNILSSGEVYNPSGYLIQTPRPTTETKVLTQKQALELLRLRGYVIMDDPLEPEPLSA